MGADAEMKDAPPAVDASAAAAEAAPQGKDEEKKKRRTEYTAAYALFQDLLKMVREVAQGVAVHDPRRVARVVRQLNTVRKRVRANPGALSKAVRVTLPAVSAVRADLLLYVPDTTTKEDATMEDAEAEEEKKDEGAEEKKDEDGKAAAATADEVVVTLDIVNVKESVPDAAPVPEVEALLHVLAFLYVVDQSDWAAGKALTQRLTATSKAANRRLLDGFAAQAWAYYSLCTEKTGELKGIRYELLAAYRTACLRHDEDGQAMLLNLLLRNYLSTNEYGQAEKLVSRSAFPTSASNSQLARNLYYMGRIHAVQLDYEDANRVLTQALRKAPQVGAVGFRQHVQKLLIVVQLLMGVVPARATFRQPAFKKALQPYLCITTPVRIGDLVSFRAAVDEHAECFRRDHTYTLIMRLRHNVIRTGLLKINTAYSRIALSDICAKLGLESVEETEGVVAKAIRDGVIDAVIDHAGGFIKSREVGDVYASSEPLAALHKRVQFCLTMRNDAVKALQYPEKEDLEARARKAEERRKRQEEEDALADEVAAAEDEEEEEE